MSPLRSPPLVGEPRGCCCRLGCQDQDVGGSGLVLKRRIVANSKYGLVHFARIVSGRHRCHSRLPGSNVSCRSLFSFVCRRSLIEEEVFIPSLTRSIQSGLANFADGVGALFCQSEMAMWVSVTDLAHICSAMLLVLCRLNCGFGCNLPHEWIVNQ